MKESGIGIYSNGACGHIITIPNSPLANGTINTAMKKYLNGPRDDYPLWDGQGSCASSDPLMKWTTSFASLNPSNHVEFQSSDTFALAT